MSSARAEIDADRIATIWLDAPGKRVNTLSRQMWADLTAALAEIERERSVGVVITSKKRESFVVGADLFEIRDMTDEQGDDYIRTGQEILQRLEDLSVPTVAAINGDALGGGLELAFACKMRIAVKSSSLKIGLPEVTLGLVPGWGGTVRLAQLVGLNNALPRIIGGLVTGVEDSESFLDAVVPAIQLMDEAKARLQQPLSKRQGWIRQSDRDHLQIEMMRQFILKDRAPTRQEAPLRVLGIAHALVDDGNAAGFEAERRPIVELRRTPEAQAALKAFTEKRKPN